MLMKKYPILLIMIVAGLKTAVPDSNIRKFNKYSDSFLS
nr:hypothetical protein [Mucilaginibacter sp. FT3.2]